MRSSAAFALILASVVAPSAAASSQVAYDEGASNPLSVSGTVKRDVDANARGWACRAGRLFVSDGPLLDLTMNEEAALTMTVDDGEWVLLFDERFVCSTDLNSKKLRYTAGRRYRFYAAAARKDAAPHEVSITIVKDRAPRVFPATVPRASLPVTLPAPWTRPVKLADRRPVRDCGQQGFARQPDVLLSVASPVAAAHLEALAKGAPVGLRVLGPLEQGSVSDRPTCRPARGAAPLALKAGTWAIWVGGGDDAPDTVTLRVRDAAVPLDPFALTAPAEDAPVAARSLEAAYLNLDLSPLDDPAQSPAFSERLWLKAPRALMVVAAADLTSETAEHVGPGTRASVVDDFPKKNEPLLVVRQAEKLQVLTVDGQRYAVAGDALALAPEGKLTLPTSPRVPAGEPSDDELIASPSKRFARDAKKLAKQQAKEAACYVKAFAKLDKEKKATEADVEAFHRGEVAQWAQSIDAKVRKKCRSAKVDKARAKLIKKMRAPAQKARKASLKKVHRRVNKLF